MGRFKNALAAGGILLGAIVLAVVMFQLRPEPPMREPPSLIPFVTTAPTVAGEGAIPVFGAGTVRPHAEIDVAAQINADGESTMRAVEGGTRQELATRARKDVAVDFLKVEEAALDEQPLPASRRQHVKRYFNAIRKSFEGE